MKLPAAAGSLKIKRWNEHKNIEMDFSTLNSVNLRAKIFGSGGFALLGSTFEELCCGF